MKLRNPFSSLSRFEWGLWIASVLVVAGSFFVGSRADFLTLIASLIGVTALIFVARGDVFGQLLTVVFSIVYAVISWRFRYFGEMITYLGMTLPIAAISVVTWLKHPYAADGSEVRIGRMTRTKTILLLLMTAVVTFVFYFILAAFDTANLSISTVSVATSFLAASLQALRVPAYALAYGANDLVLIVLWVLATAKDPAYLPMVLCFVMFFLNDAYGFVSWHKRRALQQQTCA